MKNFIFVLLSVLFAATGFAQEKTNPYARNIVIVFDASGSMKDSISDNNGGEIKKIIAAKRAILKAVELQASDTNIGLFVFGDVVDPNPVPIGPKNYALIRDAIANIKPEGGTPLGEYIQKAADQLLSQREKNMGYGWYQLIVVTDGEAGDKNLMRQVATEVLRRGLAMDVVGVGMTEAHSLAKQSTSYRAANDMAALDKALEEVTAETTPNASTDNNDFELISWLSDDQAKTIISTFGNNENQPLFEKPKVFEAPVQQTVSVGVDSNPQTTQNQQTAQSGDSLNVLFIVLAFFAFLVIISIIIR